MLWQTILYHQPSAELSGLSQTIVETLKATGYKPYDPFPGGLGAPIGKVTRYRLFLGRIAEQWIRLQVHPQDSVPPEISLIDPQHAALQLHLQVEDTEHFRLLLNGKLVSAWKQLEPLLQAGYSAADLEAAATSTVTINPQPGNELPPELQQMAREQGVKAQDVDKLMGKMSRRIFKKASKNDTEADVQQAQATLSGQTQGMDWSSVAGQRLAAVMGCLTVPEASWRLPTWNALTGAYQIARQQQRGKELLLPGDSEKLAAVPNALDYQLLYFSKKMA